jgi:hypothetical protein
MDRFTADIFEQPEFADIKMKYTTIKSRQAAIAKLNSVMPLLESVVAYAARVEVKGLFVPKINFGKHKGTPIAELPPAYVAWVVHKSDMPAEVKNYIWDRYPEKHKAAVAGFANRRKKK